MRRKCARGDRHAFRGRVHIRGLLPRTPLLEGHRSLKWGMPRVSWFGSPVLFTWDQEPCSVPLSPAYPLPEGGRRKGPARRDRRRAGCRCRTLRPRAGFSRLRPHRWRSPLQGVMRCRTAPPVCRRGQSCRLCRPCRRSDRRRSGRFHSVTLCQHRAAGSSCRQAEAARALTGIGPAIGDWCRRRRLPVPSAEHGAAGMAGESEHKIVCRRP